MTRAGIPFAKGHGTGNDFVILTNLDGATDLDAAQVRRLCDRRHGVGGDGVLVVTRTSAVAEAAGQSSDAAFFMDYRNADGSVAEMCGNGARVFVQYLLEERLVSPGVVPIATRGGVRRTTAEGDGTVCVEMGQAIILDAPTLTVDVGTGGLPALGVHIPNPHAVCWVDDLDQAGSLLQPPDVTPPGVFPDGVNVEFVAEVDSRHLQMRVHERGVGETQSCGTGACAAALATLVRAGEKPDGQRVRVDVPGGTVHVVWRADEEVELVGPAVIVARGVLEEHWWSP